MATETRTHKTKASAIARLPAKAASPAELAQARQASPVDVLGRVMAASASAINPDDLRALQRTIGNRAVNQLIQAKLSVGPAGDRYEQEADRVAQQVVGRINHPVDQAAGPTHSVQRAKRDEEDSQMQAGPGSLLRRDISDVGGLRLKPHSRRQSDGDQDTLPDLESSIQRARGNGHPLADRIRAPMEQALGADFSRVKIHTDARSDKLNRSIQARAFTTGQDVFVRPDEYNPGSRAGQELIAHELTHVVQQNGSVVRRASQSIGRADSAAIQRKPVKDPKHLGFYRDDKQPKLQLKLVAEIEPKKKLHFQIRNRLQALYWKHDTEDAYFEDSSFTKPFDLAKFLETHEFGAWLETYKEVETEHARIDKDVNITELSEKARRKNAISMYLLQQFITNALYRAEEIERMDYQASPLNYQENSQYLRSFATSYAKALQDTLPGDYPTSKFFLTRSGDFDQVLDKFFEVLKVTSRDLNVGTVKSGLAKTIAKAADYLYTNDEDLNNYWEVPGNPQAFVDVTSLLKATTDATLHQQITEELGNLVKRALAEGIAEELAHKEVKKSHASLGNKDQTALKDDIARGLKTHVAYEVHNAQVESQKKLVSQKSEKPASLAVKLAGEMPDFAAWLKKQAKTTKPARAFLRATDKLAVTPNEVGAQKDQKGNFEKLVKTPEFGQYLDGKKKTVVQTDFTKPEAWVAYNKLKDKVTRAFSTANMAVTTGGMLTLKGPANKYEQTGILVDDPAMGMAVKTAINKSGNVPSPTVASRKLLEHVALNKIVTDVIEKQRDKASTDTRDKLQKVKDEITKFKPSTDPSVVDVKKQLTATQEALKKFKKEYKQEVEYVKIEAEAAIKLLEGTGALGDESPLPAFVLRQLQQHLSDALTTQDKIEDFVRHIQGIHEAVILALDLDAKKPDKTFAYHAPQYKESVSDDKDKYFQGAHLTDYGLKAFSQAYDAVAAQVKADGSDTLNIEAFYNIYFELADKLKATKSTSKGDKVRLQTPSSVDEYLASKRFKTLRWERQGVDVIMIDIHPNDATKLKIAQNEVIGLIHAIFKQQKQREDYAKFKLTIIVDITLNHTAEKEIAEIRAAVQPYIKSGNLNLVFVQSLTKFAQLGMDKQSGGLIFAYNDPEKWGKFNETLRAAKTKDAVDPTIEKYFQALFMHSKDEQVNYIQAVRKNTKKLHDMLVTTFKRLDIQANAIQIAENTDEGTCYVALRYDDFVSKIYPLSKVRSFDEIHHFNEDVLEKGINRILSQTGLPVAMRFSFGFPVSNLGETGKEVRFTIGLEGAEQLQRYVDVLAYVNGQLAKEYESLAKQEQEAGPTEKLGKARFNKLTDRGQRQDFLNTITQDIKSLEDLRVKLKDLLKKDN